MKNYTVSDGQFTEEIVASSFREAAELFVSDADYGDRSTTNFVDVWVTLDDVSKRLTVAQEPIEPYCTEGCDHHWESPHEVVGGLTENPGVQGHGGGVIIREVCAVCGCYRVTDTWASHPSTGEGGLTSVSYEEPDETSASWVREWADRTLRKADRITYDPETDSLYADGVLVGGASALPREVMDARLSSPEDHEGDTDETVFDLVVEKETARSLDPEAILADLPDAEFETGGAITKACRAAGYDESGRAVVNEMNAWSLPVRKFLEVLYNQ